MDGYSDSCKYTIDAKGRLQLSRQIRAEFGIKKGVKLYLLPTGDAPRFLEIRTKDQWDDYERRFLLQAPDDVARDFVRFVDLNRQEVIADTQGRIGISKDIRKRCGLNADVVVINLGRVVEVWNPAEVGKKQAAFSKAFNKISRKVW